LWAQPIKFFGRLFYGPVPIRVFLKYPGNSGDLNFNKFSRLLGLKKPLEINYYSPKEGI